MLPRLGPVITTAIFLSAFLPTAFTGVSELGLWFMRSPEPIVAPVGDDVVFECSLNVPAEAVRWRHNGIHYLNHSVPPRPSATSRLLVKFNDEKQEGDYQCVAWFGASALASTPAKLTMAQLQPFLYLPHRVHTVTPGNNVAINCPPPESRPPAFIQYYHNNHSLPASGNILPTTGTLLLSNVTERDAGDYTCSATNYITGQLIYSHLRVTVNVKDSNEPQPPMFLYTPQTKYTVQAGQNVSLECSGVGKPVPSATWRRVQGVLQKERSELVVGALKLTDVQLSDQGQYVCELNNGVPPMVAHLVTLTVEVPPVVDKGPTNAVVEEESNTELSCEASGHPLPNIVWYLNGDTLDNDPHMSPMGGKLYIQRIQKKHAGIYQCFASNTVGVAFGSAMIQVSPIQVTAQVFPEGEEPDFEETLFVPGNSMPTNPGRSHTPKKEHRKIKDRRNKKHKGLMIPASRPNVTRLTDSSVMVRWTVPDNNGLPIQFFKVQYQDIDGIGKEGRWMTSNEDIPPHIRSYEVDGLTTDHHYRFRIAAVYSNNDNKLGRTSTKFHLQKGIVPKVPLYPPSLTKAEAMSTTAIKIHWEYLNSVLAPVDGFYVYYRATTSAGDYNKATVEGESARSFIITHLLPDTAYDIKLQSFTVGAASDFSEIISHKTQREPNATEPPTPEVIGPRDLSHLETSSHGQLYLVLGAVITGLALLLALAIAICICYRRSLPHDPSDAEGCDKTRVEAGLTIQQLEPVPMNGFLHGGAKSNGRSSNGFVTRNMNITNNPLAESQQNKVTHSSQPFKKNAMEMSYMTSQNNNCSAAESHNDMGDDLELELAAKRRASWRNTRIPRTTENYV